MENDKRGGLGAPLESLFWKVAGSLKTPAPMRFVFDRSLFAFRFLATGLLRDFTQAKPFSTA